MTAENPKSETRGKSKINARIVISGNGSADAEKQEFETLLAEKCASEGLPTLVIPNVYYLPADAPCFDPLRKTADPILFFSWLQPRAAFWVLRKLGVDGKRTESLSSPTPTLTLTPAPAPAPLPLPPPATRPIRCFNLSDKCCPGRWIEKIVQLLGGAMPGGKATVEQVAERCEERWYPVLDYDRCTNCRECMEFCLFGVYDTDAEGRILVAVPDACKPGCPACSRVCPNQAIMFPLHDSDPAIAGSDEGTIQPFDMGAESLQDLRKEYQEGRASIQDVLKACGCKTKSLPPRGKRGASGTGPDHARECPCAKDNDRGYFDKLIDELVKD